jgi:hypothetical protein
MESYHNGTFKVNSGLLSTWNLAQQQKAYELGMKTNWSQPNSTDIHSVINIRNLASYLIKYMTKTDTNKHTTIKRSSMSGYSKPLLLQRNISTNAIKYLRSIASHGRLWGCSSVLSSAKGTAVDLDGNLSDELTRLRNDARCHVFDDKYFSVFNYDLALLKLLNCDTLYGLVTYELLTVFNYIPPSILPF